MPINRYTVAVDQVEQRIRLRLAGTGNGSTGAGGAGAGAGGAAKPAVAWGDDRETIVLHLDTLKVRAKDGWLLCNLNVNAPSITPSTLQFLFFLGRDGNGDDTTAGATINASDAAGAALVQAWGQQLERVIWDGVLDVLEGVVNYAGQKAPGHALSLVSFMSADKTVLVEVETA